jgi:hypothetical protein
MFMDSVQTVIHRQQSTKKDSDDGYSIGSRRGDPAKVFGATSHSFDRDSNVTDVSDVQFEKHHLQSTSTDAGIMMAVKPLL